MSHLNLAPYKLYYLLTFCDNRQFESFTCSSTSSPTSLFFGSSSSFCSQKKTFI